MAKKIDPLLAASAAGINGFMFNFGDEVLGKDFRAIARQAQDERPGLYAAANLVGNLAPWSKISSALMKSAAPGLPFLSRAAMIDSVAGGAYGAGGWQVGDVPIEERLKAGAIGAATGGIASGLVPPMFKFADDARMNLPVLQGKPPLHADQSLVFAGGRKADDVVGEALSRDEALARDGGAKTLFGRNGAEGAPLDVDGPNVRSLFDLAGRNPKGREVAGKNVDMRVRDAIDARLKGAGAADGRPVVLSGSPERLKKGGADYRGRARDDMATLDSTLGAEMNDLVAALDDPAAHQEWVRFAREVFDGDVAMQTAAARRIVEHIHRRFRTAKGEELRALYDRLGRNGDLTRKLKALGVTFDKTTKTKAPYAPKAGEFSSADDRLALREPAARIPKGREEPPDMARAGLSDEDAQALMEALHATRRVNYVPPRGSNTPMLEAQAKAGAKWANPFVDFDRGVGMAGYWAGKPTSLVVDQQMHGGGLEQLPRDIREIMDEQANQGRTRAAGGGPASRWAYGFAG